MLCDSLLITNVTKLLLPRFCCTVSMHKRVTAVYIESSNKKPQTMFLSETKTTTRSDNNNKQLLLHSSACVKDAFSLSKQTISFIVSAVLH